MKKTAWLLSVGLLAAAAIVPGQASSHREAPLIALDPAADNTDVYAFVDPNDPDMVTLIANYIPFQSPNGGPNFYPFDPNVLYVDNGEVLTSAGRAATSAVTTGSPANTSPSSARPAATRHRFPSSPAWTGRSTAPIASVR